MLGRPGFRAAVVLLVAVLAGLNVVQYVAGRRSDREVIDEFAKLWLHSPGPHRCEWLGIPVLQNPMDVWVTQELIHEVAPDYVVETGTLMGGSALVWASVLEQVNPSGRVITIDIEDRTEEARTRPLWSRRIEFLHGSSVDPQIVASVARRVAGKKVVVILDSDHRREHVLAELRAYTPLVPVGSYVIVQDTVFGHPVPPLLSGPLAWEAVHEFVTDNDAWQADPRFERLLFTMHPGGYLRRLR